MSIDPRIAARRRDVIEGSARRSLARFVKWLAIASLLGGLAWAVQSPLFQLDTLTVFGVTHSSTAAVLAAEQVEEGRPLILIRPSRIEEALRNDPWVADATVGVVFPDSVEVSVVERRATAWIISSVVRLLVADDGIVLPQEGFDSSLPTVRLADLADIPVGELLPDERARGAVAFLTALDPAISSRGSVSESDGELWFDIPGMRARLGRPIEMVEKAAALMALMDRGVPEGAIVHLIAPTRPAIETPEAEG